MFRKNAMIFWRQFVWICFALISISTAFAQVPMISFLSDRTGDDEVFLMFNDGTVRKLTKNKSRTIDPTWSADGTIIIYGTNKDAGGEAFDIVTIGVNTGKEENLTQGNFGNNMQKPRWAPAGEARALVESPNLPDGDNWDIGLIDLTGRRLRADDIINVSNAGGEATGQDKEAAWSPDGKMIAFESERDGKFDIFVAEMDAKKPGAKQTNLTKDDNTNRRPRWSPDSKTIIFESNGDGDWEIYSIDTDGNNLVQLTENDKTDRNAEWSSAGIVFESSRDGNFEIYRMNPDGTNQVNLTNNAGLDSKAVWAPNGSKILFESRRDGNREIYTMEADGSNVQNLTNNSAKDVFARWNPQFFFLAVEPRNRKLVTFGEVKHTHLYQNYPNPFNPETWFPYYLGKESSATIQIYNIDGDLVRLLDIGKQPEGEYLGRDKAAYWDGRNRSGQIVASGVYFYELQTDGFSQTRKMLLMK